MSIENNAARAALFRKSRIDHGITQAKAAQMLHVGIRTLQKWDYGEHPMDSRTWELWCRKLRECPEPNDVTTLP